VHHPARVGDSVAIEGPIHGRLPDNCGMVLFMLPLLAREPEKLLQGSRIRDEIAIHVLRISNPKALEGGSRVA
jgi:hypothetical protein